MSSLILAAADSYLTYASAAIERQEGAAAAAAYNAQTRALFIRKANAALNDTFNRMNPQPGICARWIDAIAAGDTGVYILIAAALAAALLFTLAL